MAKKKGHKPEELVAKLRQVDVLVSQGRSVADAIRAIGVTEVCPQPSAFAPASVPPPDSRCAHDGSTAPPPRHRRPPQCRRPGPRRRRGSWRRCCSAVRVLRRHLALLATLTEGPRREFRSPTARAAALLNLAFILTRNVCFVGLVRRKNVLRQVRHPECNPAAVTR